MGQKLAERMKEREMKKETMEGGVCVNVCMKEIMVQLVKDIVRCGRDWTGALSYCLQSRRLKVRGDRGVREVLEVQVNPCRLEAQVVPEDLQRKGAEKNG